MTDKLPLSALLAQALIAYTIEFDSEFEQRVPHMTTVGTGASRRSDVVWLVSQVMWTNFIRFIGDDGTPVRELQAQAFLSEPGIKSRLHHLEWWRYLRFAPDPSDPRAKPRYRDLLVHLTPAGARARDAWKPLNAVVDKGWRARFGAAASDQLAKSLRTIVTATGRDLPDHMPVVDYGDGMRASLVLPEDPATPSDAEVARLGVSALLSRALLALTLEYERVSEISLTQAANVIRVIEDGGTSLRDLPMRAGVAKEGIVAATNFLKKRRIISVGTDKAKMVKLTAKGKSARGDHERILAEIEERWEKKCGKAALRALRDSLTALGEPNKKGASVLAEAVQLREGSWRTVKPYRELTEAFIGDPRGKLPHHPMVLHRGGFPDGS